MLRNGTYISGDEVEIHDALKLGYERVCQHPIEVGILGPDDMLVIDFNFIQFGNTAAALRLVRESARNGVPAGIHTFNVTRAIRDLLEEPLVVIGKTHRATLVKLRRLIAARPSRCRNPHQSKTRSGR